MDTPTRPFGHNAESDPYFQGTDVGPTKEPADPAPGRERGRRSYRRRMAVLGLFGAAMGLGLLGFGLCAAGDRFVGWLRRGARWPEE